MRFDRAVTLGLAGPMRRLGLGPQALRLPVLMYHSVSDAPEAGTSPYYRVCTSPARFAEQMRALGELGWTGVSLREGLSALDSGAGDGRRLAVITFDDGFHDFMTEAFPVLRRQGFSATMYLPTEFIGESRRAFKGRDCLTWPEVRALHAEGIEFGSHTATHPVLYGMAAADIERELRSSKAAVEDALGAEAASFSYPFAFPQADRPFVARLGDLLRGLGYRNAVTTVVGRCRPEDDRFSLRRLPANGDDDGALFRAKLEGDYDWLAAPQAAFKSLRRLVRPGHDPRRAPARPQASDTAP